LAKQGTAIPIKTIEKDYVLAWVLVGIACSGMARHVSFKGGTALKKFYFPDYRFSEDLDFTLLRDLSMDELESMLHGAYSAASDKSGIRLASASREEHEDGYTVYVTFSGPLGAGPGRNAIKMDFTLKEVLINKPLRRRLLREYQEYADIRDDIELSVYPLAEIFVEKCVSILSPYRNEPRDPYDLWYLTAGDHVEYEFLGGDIRRKAASKKLKSVDVIGAFARKKGTYQGLWERRLGAQVVGLPPFDKVYRELRRSLRVLKI